jgi:hypothetical protein
LGFLIFGHLFLNLLKVCFGQTSLGGLTLIDSGHYLCDFSTDNAAAGSIFELSGGLLEAEFEPLVL